MRLHVLSDLHISDANDSIYSDLLHYLREQVWSGDRVVFAGDVFDLFVGKRRIFTDEYREFFSELRALGDRSVEIDYIEGNHDFILKPAFVSVPKVRLVPREVLISSSGRNFYIAHGDLVDRSDMGYRVMRLLFRSPLMKAFVAWAPAALFRGVADFVRNQSRGERTGEFGRLPLPRQTQVRRIFRSFAAEKMLEGFDYVFLGHCHDLDETKFKVGDREGVYMNVGYPRVHGSIIRWDEADGEAIRVPLHQGTVV